MSNQATTVNIPMTPKALVKLSLMLNELAQPENKGNATISVNSDVGEIVFVITKVEGE